jgi:hypothetical protein
MRTRPARHAATPDKQIELQPAQAGKEKPITNLAGSAEFSAGL